MCSDVEEMIPPVCLGEVFTFGGFIGVLAFDNVKCDWNGCGVGCTEVVFKRITFHHLCVCMREREREGIGLRINCTVTILESNGTKDNRALGRVCV